jgi:hypothetical protein
MLIVLRAQKMATAYFKNTHDPATTKILAEPVPITIGSYLLLSYKAVGNGLLLMGSAAVALLNRAWRRAFLLANPHVSIRLLAILRFHVRQIL